MKTVYDIIVTLQKCSGTNSKISILEKNKDNSDLKQYLWLVYNVITHNFYQKKVEKILSLVSNPKDYSIYDLYEISVHLSTRTVTGNAARDYLTEKWVNASDESKKLIEWMIERDIKAGIAATTINKVWPGLIDQVPYMRCDLVKNLKGKYKIENWPWSRGVYGQTKYDGMFANLNYNDDGSIIISSRAGSKFPMSYFSGIVNETNKILTRGHQYHGELLIYNDGKVLPREISNGMLNSILQEGESLPDNHEIVYIIWDCIPIKNAVPKGKCEIPYSQRFGGVALSIQLADNELQHLKIAKTKMLYSISEAWEFYREQLANSEEGAVIKHPDMFWEDNTSKGQIKLKVVAECDLKIVGYKPGEGKFESTFGSIICRTSDDLLEVSISGLKDSKRKEIWDNKEFYVGKILKVLFNSIMKPTKEGDLYSLFLPRFDEERFDKLEADTLERVFEQYDNALGLE